MKGKIVKKTKITLGVFALTTLSACTVNNGCAELDIPKLSFQIGLGIAGLALTHSIKNDHKDTVIGKKINRRFK